MADLLGSVRRGVQIFFAWWLGELAGLIPPRLSQAARRDRHRVILALSADEISVSEILADREQVLGGVRRSEPGHAERVAALLRKARRRRSGVTLRLAPDAGLRKLLSLPLAARNDLEQLLRFEMDRLTPFRAEDVFFAHRVVSTEHETDRMTVELQIAPRAAVEHALAVAEACGVASRRVELAAPGGPTPAAGEAHALNLLPQDPSDLAPGSRLNRWLALIVLALAVVAVAIPLQQQRSTAADLDRQVAAAKQAAEQSLELRARLEQLEAHAGFLTEQKDRTPMITRVLAELTRVIPDQAYVEQLDLGAGTIDLRGYATTASDLIALLEQSPLFRSPQFRSPVTRDPGLGLERFHLSVELGAEDS